MGPEGYSGESRRSVLANEGGPAELPPGAVHPGLTYDQVVDEVRRQWAIVPAHVYDGVRAIFRSI